MSRLRLVQDDSGHWYAIPSDRRKDFNRWVESYEAVLEEGDFHGYDEFRLNMHPSNYTFTDLQEEK